MGGGPTEAQPYQTESRDGSLAARVPDVEAKSLKLAKRSSVYLGKALFPTFHLGDLFGDRPTRLLT